MSVPVEGYSQIKNKQTINFVFNFLQQFNTLKTKLVF